MLGCCFENAGNQGWHGRAKEHGVAVPSCCPRMLGFLHGFAGLCCFFIFFVWEMCLGCKLGQMATLALIPNHVYEHSNDQVRLSFVVFG